MRALIPLFLVLPAVLGCSRDAAPPAATPSPSPPPLTFRERSLVDRETLEAMLGQPDVRILDTRPLDEYAVAHVPGAVRVDPGIWKAKGHEPGGLVDTAFWSEALGELGIGPRTSVVVYGSTSPTNAARVWWHLRFAGVERVMLLDGSWPLWEAGGMPTEAETPQFEAVAFTPNFQTSTLAQMPEVLAAATSADAATILDCRSLGEFEGKEVRGERGGHIPGAVHLEWKELLRATGEFKSDEDLRALFAERGVASGKTVITHCHSGGRASLGVFGLMLAGIDDTKPYYGGWTEWSANDEAPVEGNQ